MNVCSSYCLTVYFLSWVCQLHLYWIRTTCCLHDIIIVVDFPTNTKMFRGGGGGGGGHFAGSQPVLWTVPDGGADRPVTSHSLRH